MKAMRIFDFSVPTRVFFGNGELRRLQEIAPTTGKRALLLAAEQTMKQTGILDRNVNRERKK
jgi:alcohol dehydrogenase YqhD (iron-dependent ADH family)